MVPYNNSAFLHNESESCENPLPWVATMVVANLLSTIVGASGNALVCVAVWRTASLHTTINYYMVSLAIADLMVTLLVQPLMVVVLLGRFTGVLAACGSTLDVLYRVIGNFSCSASFLNLCFISIERFLAVVRPFSTYKNTKSNRFIFLVATSWSIPLIYVTLRITGSKIATTYLATAIFTLGYIWMISCYAVIVVFLRRQANEEVAVCAATDSHRRQRKTERKITITVVLVIACFTVMWIPLFYFRVSGNPTLDSGFIYELAVTMALCNSSFNPIIYAFRYKKYRKAFNSILFAAPGHHGLSQTTTRRTRTFSQSRKLSSAVRKMSLGQTMGQTQSSSSTPLSTPPTERRHFILQETVRSTNV